MIARPAEAGRALTPAEIMNTVHLAHAIMLGTHLVGMRPGPELLHSTSGHPIGMPFKLGDIVLRVADICQNHGMDLSEVPMTTSRAEH